MISHTRREEFVGFRVSPELKQRLRLKAVRKGMTMSEYLRSLLRKEVEVEQEAV